MRRRYGSVLVGVLVLALAGCGGESGDEAAPETFETLAVGDGLPAVGSTPSPEPATASASVTPSAASSQPSRSQPSAASGTALALLGTLAVKGRAPMTGYERDAYGQAWADVDRNGCDTRNDMLTRDLREVAYKPGTRDCVVLTGRLAPDPYTATDIAFERGGANEIDIDHVVALANSWVTGAQFWDEPKRIALANDPANLLAVDSSANRQKGAGDAATWLPASKSYRCSYVARQVAVKAKYELWVTAAEKDAIARVLGDCPDQAAPDAGELVLPPAGRGAAYEPTQAPAPPKPESSKPRGSATDPRFPYCKDAVAAGYGPYVSGKDPEYAWYRDADGDGTVCE